MCCGVFAAPPPPPSVIPDIFNRESILLFPRPAHDALRMDSAHPPFSCRWTSSTRNDGNQDGPSEHLPLANTSRQRTSGMTAGGQMPSCLPSPPSPFRYSCFLPPSFPPSPSVIPDVSNRESILLFPRPFPPPRRQPFRMDSRQRTSGMTAGGKYCVAPCIASGSVFRYVAALPGVGEGGVMFVRGCPATSGETR